MNKKLDISVYLFLLLQVDIYSSVQHLRTFISFAAQNANGNAVHLRMACVYIYNSPSRKPAPEELRDFVKVTLTILPRGLEAIQLKSSWEGRR